MPPNRTGFRYRPVEDIPGNRKICADWRCNYPASVGLVSVTKRYWSGWGWSADETFWAMTEASSIRSRQSSRRSGRQGISRCSTCEANGRAERIDYNEHWAGVIEDVRIVVLDTVDCARRMPGLPLVRRGRPRHEASRGSRASLPRRAPSPGLKLTDYRTLAYPAGHNRPGVREISGEAGDGDVGRQPK